MLAYQRVRAGNILLGSPLVAECSALLRQWYHIITAETSQPTVQTLLLDDGQYHHQYPDHLPCPSYSTSSGYRLQVATWPGFSARRSEHLFVVQTLHSIITGRIYYVLIYISFIQYELIFSGNRSNKDTRAKYHITSRNVSLCVTFDGQSLAD